MKEESQLEDMRAALRGDRERAECARLRSAENVHALLVPEPPLRTEQEPATSRPGLLARLFGR